MISHVDYSVITHNDLLFKETQLAGALVDHLNDFLSEVAFYSSMVDRQESLTGSSND